MQGTEGIWNNYAVGLPDRPVSTPYIPPVQEEQMEQTHEEQTYSVVPAIPYQNCLEVRDDRQ